MSTEARNRIATRLKQAREARGITQAALAKKLRERGMQIAPSGIAKIESGARNLEVTEAALLSDALNLPWAELFTLPVDETTQLDRLYQQGEGLWAEYCQLVTRAGHTLESFLALTVSILELGALTEQHIEGVDDQASKVMEHLNNALLRFHSVAVLAGVLPELQAGPEGELIDDQVPFVAAEPIRDRLHRLSHDD